MLRSIGKQSEGIRGVSHEEEKEGYGGKDLQKRKVLSLNERVRGDGILIPLPSDYRITVCFVDYGTKPLGFTAASAAFQTTLPRNLLNSASTGNEVIRVSVTDSRPKNRSRVEAEILALASVSGFRSPASLNTTAE